MSMVLWSLIHGLIIRKGGNIWITDSSEHIQQHPLFALCNANVLDTKKIDAKPTKEYENHRFRVTYHMHMMFLLILEARLKP